MKRGKGSTGIGQKQSRSTVCYPLLLRGHHLSCKIIMGTTESYNGVSHTTCILQLLILLI